MHSDTIMEIDPGVLGEVERLPFDAWRVGRQVGRTLYRGEALIGVMDAAEDAAAAALCRTAAPALATEVRRLRAAIRQDRVAARLGLTEAEVAAVRSLGRGKAEVQAPAAVPLHVRAHLIGICPLCELSQTLAHLHRAQPDLAQARRSLTRAVQLFRMLYSDSDAGAEDSGDPGLEGEG